MRFFFFFFFFVFFNFLFFFGFFFFFSFDISQLFVFSRFNCSYGRIVIGGG